MLEIIVGAILLRRLIGPNAALDRAEQIVGMLVALVTATAISAVCGTLSMLAGGVIEWSEAVVLPHLVAGRHGGRAHRASADPHLGARPAAPSGACAPGRVASSSPAVVF